MSIPTLRSLLLTVPLICPSGAGDDATPKAPDTPAAKQPASAEVAALIKQLDADQFATREAASQALLKAGKSAIAPLADAATGDSLEVSMRAIAILRKHLQDPDQATRKLARQTLSKLAADDNPAIAAAAQDAIRANPDRPVAPSTPGVLLPGEPAQFQFNMLAGQRARRFSSRISNGVKQIDVQENDRQVRITDDPRAGIKMEITEKKDGKEETKSFEAKDADELKKKHPQAFDLYQECSKPQQVIDPLGDMRERIRQLQLQMNRDGFPAPAAFPGLLGRLGIAQDIIERLDRASKQLEAAVRLIEQQAGRTEKADELHKALQELKDVKKQLDEAMARLRE